MTTKECSGERKKIVERINAVKRSARRISQDNQPRALKGRIGERKYPRNAPK
jgi:hypothetical protein